MLKSGFALLFCAGSSTSDTLALPLCYRTSAVYFINAHGKLWQELWTLIRFLAKAFRKAGWRSLRSKPWPKTAKSTDREELCGNLHNHKGWSQRCMVTFATRTKGKAERLIENVFSGWFGGKARSTSDQLAAMHSLWIQRHNS